MQGIVQKVMTMPDGSIRFFVDVPVELAPDDLKAWMFEYVRMDRVGEVQKKTTRGERTHGDKKKAGAGRAGKKRKKG